MVKSVGGLEPPICSVLCTVSTAALWAQAGALDGLGWEAEQMEEPAEAPVSPWRPFCLADPASVHSVQTVVKSTQAIVAGGGGEMTSFLTVPETPCGGCLIPSKIPVIVVPQFAPRA